ncbi:RNA polymerase recycling motor HelD [Alicyclobacillus dauci]|uniref:UvrD-helicase domain-containing protein n=1 Tax=Alicyclobacillus dauci TaxID=1475485 RepID=A0ABY6Z5G4_9BACL|nr:RNA polymerase recycling motor HelD [Alicyclobacillus dauci]WAH37265.1 UvrD-helicase domain-containing protein [Alicyclobacillus dauci]
MAVSEQDWRDEQTYVDHVRERIAERMDAMEVKAGSTKEDVVEIRRNFWDEVSVNLTNPDDIAETHFAIRQQAEVLADKERQYSTAAKVAKTLARLVENPFFGRVDFREDGESETDTVYIGLGSFRDEDTDEFLIYDWRAPISSLYYDHSPGRVSFQAPGGEITGEMEVKRQYVIRQGRIELMFDANVTIGDELLMEALGRHSDTQMRSIVATIQQEQNAVIRNDHSRMLIVQGAAGSGKTSAALQRVAYLLYKHRGTLTARQMVLFSPNTMFNSYVASVLPELGEENLEQTTFQEYLERRLKRHFQVEDPFDQLEFVLTEENATHYRARVEGIRYKSSYAFTRVIRAYCESLLNRGMRFRPISFRGKVIVSREQMREHFYSYEPNFRMNHRMESMRKWLLEQLVALEDAEKDADWVEDEVELLDPDDYRKAHQRVSRMNAHRDEVFNEHGQEREILGRMVVHRKLAKIRKRVQKLQFIDIPGLYRTMLEHIEEYAAVDDREALPDNWTDIARYTLEAMEQKQLPYEDATPYLYMMELVLGMSVNTSIQHVFIDEAQDYSRLQIEFIRHLFPRARMTILGDLNQSVYVHEPALARAHDLGDVYGEEHTEFIRLSRSYRSTFEIVEFTRRMTASDGEIVPFERHGERPRVIRTTDAEHNRRLVNEVRSLQDQGYSSIAVICKTAAESEKVYAAVKDDIESSLISKETTRFIHGIVVIPAYLAKGVEFDAVVVYDGSRTVYAHEHERQLFYTACTRAMHELVILSADEPSHFIADQPKDTYVLEHESETTC